MSVRRESMGVEMRVKGIILNKWFDIGRCRSVRVDG